MTVLLNARIPRTLDRLLRDWCKGAHRGAVLEAWLFEDEPARRAAEAAFADVGITARLRSAYKPLVHAFLEEIDRAGLAQVTIRYPVHPKADPKRFLLEAYPLAALLEGLETTFEPGGEDLVYNVAARYRDGRTREHSVFAPNRLRENHLDETDLTPTGWLMVAKRPGGVPAIDEAMETEIEAVFHKVMDAIAAHVWPASEPYAERILIDVTIPGIERPLAYGDEVMSTREALHEDLYFSLLEFFKRRSGRPPEDRSVQPGQIVPDIRAGDGDAEVRVTLSAFGAPRDPVRAPQVLATAEAALGLDQIHRELAALPGEFFEGRSREGRPVPGLYRAGTRPPIVITGGQHANETSGVVGSLRAAQQLLADPAASVALIPVENPDGYVLHGRLCEANPRHMHHAARYTAAGSDLDYGAGAASYEMGARLKAFALTGATLHINLHGYPAHEWTRPFTGYVPRGFELWTIPKGFFLILRHHAGWSKTARALVEKVTERLAAIPGFAAFNRCQIELCAIHSGGKPYEIIHEVPCLIAEDARHPVPLTLITEFPDETIYGEPFRFAHMVQMTTVLAAEDAHAAMTLEAA